MSHSAARIVSLMLLLAGLTLHADILFPVDRSHFEWELTLTTTGAHLPARPASPYAGANLELQAVTQPGDTVSWFHQGHLIPDANGTTLQIHDIGPAAAGVYWARITRDGHSRDTYPRSISLASPITHSVVDPSFSNQWRGVGDAWEFSLLAINPAGDIGYLRYTPVFVEGDAGWMAADGTTGTELFSWSYLQGLVSMISTALPDGSLLLNHPYLHRRWPDGSEAPVPYLGTATLDRHAWKLAEDGDLLHQQRFVFLRIRPDGSERFLYQPPDYGWEIFWSATPLRDGTGRIVLVGSSSAADETENPSRFARVVDAEGIPLEGAAAMPLLEGQLAPVPQPDGSWIEVAQETVRHFNPDGSIQGADRTLPMGDHFHWNALPDGFIYGAAPSVGILRVDANLEIDPDFYALLPPDTLALNSRPLLLDDGRLYVTGTFAHLDDHSSPFVARLNPHARAAGLSPVVGIYNAEPIIPGEPLRLQGIVVGDGPFTYEWMNLDRPLTTPPPDSVLELPAYTIETAGRYVLKVTGATGVGYSEVLDLRPNSQPVLNNLSGRTLINGNVAPLTLGFVVENRGPINSDHPAEPKPVLLRGVGPTLADFNVADPLADPHLRLRTLAGDLFADNDDWVTPNFDHAMRIEASGAFPLQPGSADSQLFASLEPGAYIIEVAAKPDESGVALGEIYALRGSEALMDLSNLSLRAHAGSGDATLTGGFVVDDPTDLGQHLRVLVRAVGPGLSDFGVPAPATDPVLRVFDADGTLVAENDDWSTDNSTGLLAAFDQLGAFALADHSADAALLLDLPPGVYTAQVQDASGIGGEALIELYRFPPD